MIIPSYSLALSRVWDLFELIKPRVTSLVIATTAGGLWCASRGISPSVVLMTLVGTGLLVAGANTLNMYLEREIDARMTRTCNRPLPAKRLPPVLAFRFGLSLAVAALLILGIGVNLVTTLLGLIAFGSYLLCYTPLKQRSALALVVGAIPGAMPPLMGWTAATGMIEPGGLVLFGILFFWQFPHFLAIALFRKEDFQRAGIRVLPLERGERAAKRWIIISLGILIPFSLAPYFLGMTGSFYLVSAILLGAVFFTWGFFGIRPAAGDRWAHSFFLASVVYLPLLLFSLLVTQSIESLQ